MTVLGPATVDGHPALEYGVTMPGVTSTLSASGHDEMHVTVAPFVARIWLDGRGRVVQVSASLPTEVTPATGAGGSGSASYCSVSSSTITLSEFGEAVTLLRPTLGIHGSPP